MTLSDSEKTDSFAKQYELWEQVRQVSRDQIGPVENPPPPESGADMPEMPPTEYTLEVINDLAASPLVDYQFDGAKTSTIIADSLYEDLARLKNFAQVEQQLQHITTTLVKMLQVPDISFSLSEVNQRSHWWHPQGLEGWLRLQPITPQDSTPLTPLTTYPTVDEKFPFIVYRRAQDSFALEQRRAYWSNRGLSARLIQDDALINDESRWDKERLQATLYQPYLLLCSGILRGQQWGESIVARLQREAAANPVVIIIADGIADDTPLYQDQFVSLLLPAPHDQEMDETEYLPRRPIMQRMAEVFGAQVVNLWVDPRTKEEPAWETLGDALGRCEVAQIDRHRTVLVEMNPPPDAARVEGSAVDEWFPLMIHAFTLPLKTDESLAQAEMLVRTRIELAEGVVAGGCATLYWLASRLHVDTRLTPLVQTALRAPLRHLLKNASIDLADERGQRIAAWIRDGDAPTRTFFIDVNGTVSNNHPPFPIIEGVFPVLLGDARDLGIVNPRLQIIRTIQEALRIAFELAVLYSKREEA